MPAPSPIGRRVVALSLTALTSLAFVSAPHPALAQTGSATGGNPATADVPPPAGSATDSATDADASAEASSPDVQQLRAEMQELRVELAQLKLAMQKLGVEVGSAQPPSLPAADTGDAAAGSASAGALASADDDAGHFGRLESVQRMDPEMDDQQQQRLEELRQDVEESEQQVAQAKSQMATVGRGTVGVGYTGNDDLDERDAQIRAQRRENDAAQAAQRSQIAAAQELLRTRQQDLQAFQDEYGPHYQITVRQQDKTVELRVSPETFETATFDPDLPGLRWEGQLIEMNDQQESWQAESILSLPEESLNRGDDQPTPTPAAPMSE